MTRRLLCTSLVLLLLAVGPAWSVGGAPWGEDGRSEHPSALDRVVRLFMPVAPSRGTLAAQDPGRLASTARVLARSWAGGSDRAVARHLAQGRINLHLEGGVSASLPTRQAVAVIRDYLRGYDAGEVELARVALVEGSRDRGFAELRWSARRSGTSQTLVRTVFLGFRYDGGDWTVDEVRVLP